MIRIKIFIICLYLSTFIIVSEVVFILFLFELFDYHTLLKIVWTIIPRIFTIWVLIFFIVLVLNIISSIKLYINNDTKALEKYSQIMKILLKPFWIIHKISCIVLSLMIVFATRGIGIIIIPVFFVATFILRTITSVYEVEKIRKMNTIISIFKKR